MQRGVDSLTFIISGVNDLVDATLIERLNDKPGLRWSTSRV